MPGSVTGPTRLCRIREGEQKGSRGNRLPSGTKSSRDRGGSGANGPPRVSFHRRLVEEVDGSLRTHRQHRAGKRERVRQRRCRQALRQDHPGEDQERLRRNRSVRCVGSHADADGEEAGADPADCRRFRRQRRCIGRCGCRRAVASSVRFLGADCSRTCRSAAAAREAHGRGPATGAMAAARAGEPAAAAAPFQLRRLPRADEVRARRCGQDVHGRQAGLQVHDRQGHSAPAHEGGGLALAQRPRHAER